MFGVGTVRKPVCSLCNKVRRIIKINKYTWRICDVCDGRSEDRTTTT